MEMFFFLRACVFPLKMRLQQYAGIHIRHVLDAYHNGESGGWGGFLRVHVCVCMCLLTGSILNIYICVCVCVILFSLQEH